MTTFTRSHSGRVHILKGATRALCGARSWPDYDNASAGDFKERACRLCLRISSDARSTARHQHKKRKYDKPGEN